MTIPFLLTEDVGNPPWTGCTFTVAVMMAAYGGIHLPHGITTDEHYALVRAAGMTVGNEGATLDDIQRGYLARYGVQAHVFSGSIVQLYALGDVYALVQGSYGALPVHYRRWDTGFTGIHAMGYIPKLNWLQDPLSNQRMIDAGWNGETITLPVLSAYALGFGGSVHALYLRANEFASGGSPANPTGGAMSTVVLNPAIVGTLTVKPDPAIRWVDLATGTLMGPPGVNFGHPIAVAGRISPPIGIEADGWQVTINGKPSFLLARNATYVPVPATDCSAAVKAATDPLNAKITAAKAALG